MAHVATTYPDELESDFWRFYGFSWRHVPVWRAAILTFPLSTRPECELCRVMDPQWWWRDPLFNVAARFMGIEPKNLDSRERADKNSVAFEQEALIQRLNAPRESF